MLCDKPNRSHHRYSTMLDLGDTQLPEALLVAHLGKPERIKESKRLGGAELLGRLEERWLGGLSTRSIEFVRFQSWHVPCLGADVTEHLTHPSKI